MVPTVTIPAKRVINFALEPEKLIIGAMVAAPADDDEDAADEEASDEAADEWADEAADEECTLELTAEEADEAPEVAVEFPATLAVPTRESVEAELEEAIFVMRVYVK